MALSQQKIRDFAAILVMAVWLGYATSASATLVELARYEFLDGASASTDVHTGSAASSYDARTSLIGNGLNDSGISAGGNAFIRTSATPQGTTSPLNPGITPATDLSYHSFTLSFSGLPLGHTIDLTSLTYDHRVDNSPASFRGFVGVYSSLTGFATAGNALGNTNYFNNTNLPAPFTIDLTPFGGLSGLTGGDSVEIRLYFADNRGPTLSQSLQRLDNVVLNGELNITAIPEPAAMAFFSLVGLTCYFLRRPGNDISAGA